MKPTYEYCNFCKRTTQHLSGYCSCYESTPSTAAGKVLKVEYYNTPPEVITSIKDLQSIYSKIKNNV